MLEAEAEREAQQAAASEPVLFADDLLPGVDTEEVSLGGALRRGGTMTFVVLLLLTSVDELESSTLAVLAPDIRNALGVGNGTIVFLSSASGAFLVLGALPMGWLADRFRRGRVIGWASLPFPRSFAFSGLVANAFQLFLARLGVGIAKSNTIPVHGSLLADTYPIGVRGRIGATLAMGSRLAGALSPVLVAGIAALAGGRDGWRWPFLLLGDPRSCARGLGVPAPGAAARPVREEGRARRGHRGREAGADLRGGGVRAAVADPHDEDAWWSRSPRWASACSPPRCWRTSSWRTNTGPRRSSAACSGPIGGLAVLVVLPFVGRVLRPALPKDPTRALRLVGL